MTALRSIVFNFRCLFADAWAQFADRDRKPRITHHAPQPPTQRIRTMEQTDTPTDHLNPQGFDTGDIVLHALTATEVEVACVREDTLIRRGWPATEYLVADCTLVKKATAEERAAALRILASMNDPRDPRCVAARRALALDAEQSTSGVTTAPVGAGAGDTESEPSPGAGG